MIFIEDSSLLWRRVKVHDLNMLFFGPSMLRNIKDYAIMRQIRGHAVGGWVKPSKLRQVGGHRAASIETSLLIVKVPNYQESTEKLEWRRIVKRSRVARRELSSEKNAE